MNRRRLVPLAAAALLACGVAAGCSSSGPPAICVSSGTPPMPAAGTRAPDFLCRDDADPNPVWWWVSIQQGSTAPAVGQPLPPGSVAVRQPSGSAQSGEEEEEAGVSSAGSSSATSEEEDETSSNSSSMEEEESSSSSASVSEEE